MKRVILIALILIMVPAGLAWCQLPQDGALFVAARYDKITDAGEGQYAISGGLATPLGFAGLWEFAYIEIGNYGSLATETAYIVGKRMWVGVMAGPNIDWEETGSQPVAYFTGASGMIAGYNFNDKVGAFGMMKYNFRFSEENQALYQNGWTAGIGLNFFP